MAKHEKSESESSQYSDLSSEEESDTSENDECSEEEKSENDFNTVKIPESDDSSDDNQSVASNNEEDEGVVEDYANSDVEMEKTQLTVRNDLEPEKTSGNIAKIDEYEYDSSDEEDLRNTIGNIPVEWYRDYKHIGYDLEGNKIVKPKSKDEMDEFLSKIDDPYYWRTVKDKLTGQNVILTDDDAELIKRIKKAHYADANYDPYPEFVDFFTYEKMIHPVTNHPETKASFIPSLGEKRAISRLVAKIKRKKHLDLPEVKKPKDDRFNFHYDIWSSENAPSKRLLRYIPAPKMKLPTHAESYNPPPEYLFTKEEEEDWKNTEPEERKQDFMPQKYQRLRHVPLYPNFVRERFERCLDLYLCPRAKKMRANVNPEDLIPVLPKPRDLQPFPTMLSLVYIGHKAAVRSISIEPKGQFFISGSDDCTVKVWEILTGRCIKTFTFENSVSCVSWCPNSEKNICIVSVNKCLYVINIGVGDKIVTNNTDNLFKQLIHEDEKVKDDSVVNWQIISEDKEEAKSKAWKEGIRVIIKHRYEIKQLTWHYGGDYFAAVMPEGGNKHSVIIHQLSKKRSSMPFQRQKAPIQRVLFHPSRPFLFAAYQRHVRIYNLAKQELTKKLMCNCKNLSSIAIHPKGDNLIIGSYDLRLSWFDLDLSNKPYKTLRYHKKAIRQVAFHPKYPLFASASDDGTVVVTHGMVYDDLTQNALIVPVKVLRGHKTIGAEGGVLDCSFHPLQPWVFSAGADSTIRLYA
ncbi:ribosome biogenesis protein bop1-A-like protein [Dinothrombium tinctorium]|uniref:Ribosome biogenesis protein BOP1 homolog n=1 Tax=Dinothrombium tinctorium TaxID=1965070 RepID=A0A3S3QSB9_9ACAR|nr:ribosome biogenesis protein bop1-A-like protein [Dinothrombium tinctorium]